MPSEQLEKHIFALYQFPNKHFYLFFTTPPPAVSFLDNDCLLLLPEFVQLPVYIFRFLTFPMAFLPYCPIIQVERSF